MKIFKGIIEKIGNKIRLFFSKENREHRKKCFSFSVVFLLFFLAFGALAGNLIRFLEVESYDVIGSEFNKRQDLLEERNIRGTIYAANGEVLAYSYEDDYGEEVREYPFGMMFAHVVGYSVNGKMGIEKIVNMNLIQSNNSMPERVSNDIEQKKNVGDSVITSLNPRLQEVAYKSLGAYKGAIIVSDIETGRILAMVSKPDFDPNIIADEWEQLLLDEESSVLVNRVTQGMYPPGSTFKILDSLAFYRQFGAGTEEYAYSCSGKHVYGERRISCYHGTVHGPVDLRTSFAKSCNSSFANIGLLLDRVAFGEVLDEMLFGQELPGGLVHNVSRVSIDADSDDNMVVQAAIGQGDSVMTPYHLNLITNAIANDGVLMTPQLITEVRNSNGKTIKTYEPEVYEQLLTKEESIFLSTLMTAVVEEGTGKRLQDANYTSAGKTGSAEFGTNPADSHAWFTGYAPAEEPKVSVTIIIEGAGTGGDYAVPVAKRLFDAYFEQFP